jgi:2-polyprenyl-3-methyl-5-hydroxy-6-metoxy-1,4-benzoquinol methylase
MSFSDKIKLQLYIKKLKYKKIKRDKKTITSDYDVGIWNKKYEDIDFESIPGMYGKDVNSTSLFVKDNKIFKGKYSDYTEKFQNQLFSIISKYAYDYPIVELGCGLGANLFQLHKRKFKNLEGYDISENAIQLAKRHSIKKGYKIKFDVLDLTKSLPNGVIENKIVFTNTCLEQLKHSMPRVLQNILKGKPKLVINFEVDYDSSDSLVKDYFDACDYQNNFVSELKNMKKQINIESINLLPLSLSPLNRLSSIIWKPIEVIS